MFGWFSPQCPVDLERKVWIEFRMRWLADQLGIERLLKAQVITPTEEFFPGPYHPTKDCVRSLMDRLAGMMGVTTQIKLAIGPEFASASGYYLSGSPPTIIVSQSILSDPYDVTATLTHELAHDILLGGGLLSSDESDHEHVTDLLLIYLGIGIIPTNNTIRDRSWREGQMEYFQIRKSGYLSAVDFGYAFALFTYARGEEYPDWMDYLRPDARNAMKKGLKYLLKTGDTLFHPDKIHQKLQIPTTAEACERLQRGTATEQLFTLWQLQQQPTLDAVTLDAIATKLADVDAAVAASAANTLGRFGETSIHAVPYLLKALSDHRPKIRTAAADALGTVRSCHQEILPALVRQLADADRDVAACAGRSIGEFGQLAQPYLRDILIAMNGAYREQSAVEYELLLALMRIDPDPKRQIVDFYQDANAERRKYFLKMLKDIQQTLKDQEIAS